MLKSCITNSSFKICHQTKFCVDEVLQTFHDLYASLEVFSKFSIYIVFEQTSEIKESKVFVCTHTLNTSTTQVSEC